MVIARTRPDKRLTLEEFLALPEEKPALEYIDGEVAQKVSPEWDHSELQYVIPSRINAYAYPRKLGVALPELRTTYSGESLVPDVAVFTWERIPRRRNARGAIEVTSPPDVAIEIASPGQGRRALLDRCRRFVEHGSRLALLADPRRRTVTVVRAGARPAVLSGDDVLDLGEVIPGLTLVVGELFTALSFD
jgi:Uma2 family endonuclease